MGRRAQGGVVGSFFNELLDAFPVHRICWDAPERRWIEWGVGWETNRLSGAAWNSRGLAGAPGGCRVRLPANSWGVAGWIYFGDFSCRREWWGDAARACTGKLLTFDYGLTALEFLDPARLGGTLRGYARHQLQEDVLAHPGEQDITAHVNFTQLQLAGERVGLRTVDLTGQERFLTRIAAAAAAERGAAWPSESVRQFQTLAHPEQLGRAFRVLVQERVGA